jgi:glycine/D-amino acid oxidase-like deaminating enzyme
VAADRIVVVGAGIIGASIAYHLVKRGAQVVIVEALRPGAGATENSFGWINATFSKRPREYFDLNQLGMASWRRLEKELGGELKVQWGGSVSWQAAGDGDHLRDQVRRHQEWGYAAHLIEEDEFRRLLPNVAPGDFGAACHSEFEGAVDPVDALKALLRQVRELGGEVRYPFAVDALKMAGGRVAGVGGSEGSVDAEVVVLASGVATGRLAETAGVSVPLQESLGVLVHTRPQPKLIDRVVLAPNVHCKQKLDGRVVVGGRIVAGAGTAHVAIAEPSPSAGDHGQKILREAARVLPGIRGVAVERVTVGHRVMPVDEYPVIGFSDRCPNLYVAAMHSGVTLAPLIGQLAALEILDNARVISLEPYRPSRFND